MRTKCKTKDWIKGKTRQKTRQDEQKRRKNKNKKHRKTWSSSDNVGGFLYTGGVGVADVWVRVRVRVTVSG